LFRKNDEQERLTCLPKRLSENSSKLKAHRVSQVEQIEQTLVIHIDRLGNRRLRCGLCGRSGRRVHDVRPVRQWRDMSMRGVSLLLRYQPQRVECRDYEAHVEAFLRTEPRARTSAYLRRIARQRSDASRWIRDEPITEQMVSRVRGPCVASYVNTIRQRASNVFSSSCQVRQLGCNVRSFAHGGARFNTDSTTRPEASETQALLRCMDADPVALPLVLYSLL